MRFKALSLCAAAALALAAALPAQAAIVNGGFETGDFSGWTVAGDTGYTGVDAFAANSGSYGAFFGEERPGSSIEQTFATTAGASYLIEFWLQLDDSAVPNSFSWSWDGVSQALLIDESAFGYTHFSGVVTATSSLSTLRFDVMNEQSFFLLDDVSASMQVPEPASAALALIAFAAMGAGVTTRRRRSASTA